MASGTFPERHTARKRHYCDWCGQSIEPDYVYKRYRWFDGNDAGTCRMHPECYEAMTDAALDEGGFIWFTPGSKPRPQIKEQGEVSE